MSGGPEAGGPAAPADAADGGRRRRLLLLLLAVLLVAAALLWLLLGGDDDAPRLPADGQEGEVSAAGGFAITGDLHGVHPGYDGDIQIELRNQQSFAIVVEEVTVSIGDPVVRVSSPAAGEPCSRTHLEIEGLEEEHVVPAEGVVTASLPVRMPPDVPDACQGATFPLTYQGAGTAVEEP